MRLLSGLLLAAFAPLLVAEAAGAAEPVATLEGDAAPAELTSHGTARKLYRLGKGKALTLKLSGPAALQLEVRVEGLGGKVPAPLLEEDGKPLAAVELNAAPDLGARTDKGESLSRPTQLPVAVAAGKHIVTVRWPAGASGDALIAVRGVQILEGAVALPLLPPEAPPPLPLLPPAPLAVAAKPAPGTSALAKPAAVPLPPAPADKKAEAAPASSTPPLAVRTRTLIATPVSGDGRKEPAQEPVVEWQRFRLELALGAERSAESYTAPAALGHAGVELDYRVRPDFPLLLAIDGRFSHQGYQASVPSGTGRGLSGADFDEQRFDGRLGAGYDLGPRILQSGRLGVMPTLAFHYLAIRNTAFPLDVAGPELGLRLRFALSAGLALRASAGFTYNVLKQTTLSAVGPAKSDLALQAGFSLPLPSDYAFDIGYRGDILVRTYDNRIAHGMSVGFHSGF